MTVSNTYWILAGVFLFSLFICQAISANFKNKESKKLYSDILEGVWVLFGLIGLFLATPLILESAGKTYQSSLVEEYTSEVKTLNETIERMVINNCGEGREESVLCSKHMELQMIAKNLVISDPKRIFENIFEEYIDLAGKNYEGDEVDSYMILGRINGVVANYILANEFTDNYKVAAISISIFKIAWPFLLGIAFGVKAWRTIAAIFIFR